MQIHIHINGEEVNIGIKDVERVIMSFKNGRMCGLESICVEFLKGDTKKLDTECWQRYQCLNILYQINGKWHTFSQYSKENPERIPTIIEKYLCRAQWDGLWRILNSLIDKKYSNLEEKSRVGIQSWKTL